MSDAINAAKTDIMNLNTAGLTGDISDTEILLTFPMTYGYFSNLRFDTLLPLSIINTDVHVLLAILAKSTLYSHDTEMSLYWQ